MTLGISFRRAVRLKNGSSVVSFGRYRFDRNKNVDDDLTFWARYLSNGQPSCNIGGVGVDDLILDFEYCAAEIPIASREIENENTH
jgi:hypothetical protein